MPLLGKQHLFLNRHMLVDRMFLTFKKNVRFSLRCVLERRKAGILHATYLSTSQFSNNFISNVLLPALKIKPHTEIQFLLCIIHKGKYLFTEYNPTQQEITKRQKKCRAICMEIKNCFETERVGINKELLREVNRC